MKLFILALVVIAAVAVIADDEEDWQNFKLQHGKLFLSPGKEAKRKAAFKAHKAVHDSLQAAAAAGEISYEPAIYAFHDLEPEEISARLKGLKKTDVAAVIEKPESRATPPINYSSVSILGAVKDQQQCGK